MSLGVGYSFLISVKIPLVVSHRDVHGPEPPAHCLCCLFVSHIQVLFVLFVLLSKSFRASHDIKSSLGWSCVEKFAIRFILID